MTKKTAKKTSTKKVTTTKKDADIVARVKKGELPLTALVGLKGKRKATTRDAVRGKGAPVAPVAEVAKETPAPAPVAKEPAKGKGAKDGASKISDAVANAPIGELTEIEKARALLLAQLGKGLTYATISAREQKAADRLDKAITEYEASHKEYLMLQLLLDALDTQIEMATEK